MSSYKNMMMMMMMMMMMQCVCVTKYQCCLPKPKRIRFKQSKEYEIKHLPMAVLPEEHWPIGFRFQGSGHHSRKDCNETPVAQSLRLVTAPQCIERIKKTYAKLVRCIWHTYNRWCYHFMSCCPAVSHVSSHLSPVCQHKMWPTNV